MRIAIFNVMFTVLGTRLRFSSRIAALGADSENRFLKFKVLETKITESKRGS